MLFWIKHPNDIVLQKYLANLLKLSDSDKIKKHVFKCERCKKNLQRYKHIDSIFSSVTAKQIPDTLLAQTIESVIKSEELLKLTNKQSNNQIKYYKNTNQTPVLFPVAAILSIGLASSLYVLPYISSLESDFTKPFFLIKHIIFSIPYSIKVVLSVQKILVPIWHYSFVSTVVLFAIMFGIVNMKSFRKAV